MGRERLARRVRSPIGIPRDLETILLKAIAREPEQRYASAAALADDLRCFLEDRPIEARRATLVERAWRWSRRNRVLAALSATAALSLLVAAILGWVVYARTMKALQGEADRRREAEIANHRAEENEALSLEVFSELFERLVARENLPSPMPGRPTRDRPAAHRPFGRARLRRAAELTTTSVADSVPDTPEIIPRMLVQAKWGAVLQRLGKLAEAEACYRRAIALQGLMIEQGPLVDRTRPDRPAMRESQARLQLETAKNTEARALLEEAAADLEAFARGFSRLRGWPTGSQTWPNPSKKT